MIALKFVTIEVASNSISAIDVPASIIDVAYRWCTHYIDDLYHSMHYDNYAATGYVAKFFIIILQAGLPPAASDCI